MTSSLLVGPFSVSHTSPVTGSMQIPNELRCPSVNDGFPGIGLSGGTDPSGSNRRTLPPTELGSSAGQRRCPSPTVTYSMPSVPKTRSPPLW